MKKIIAITACICAYMYVYLAPDTVVVIYQTEASALHETAETIEEYNPCGLVDVVCSDEKSETKPKNEIEKIILSTFPDDYPVALAVARAESGLNPHAFNSSNRDGSVDCGLFQVNSVHRPTVEQCNDPSENARLARKIYDASGWRAWSAYKNGSFQKFVE